ncbi:YbfB/YjiJ family MFS transporter [Aurantimonas sp. Leaf443]|uniref:YbfB/YjiJ family MFS transporter n=1 Tax=Aurantimonas sp. Leaf443 TaxID=1736378 RepID=UPI000700F363|nr:YbfB/YjiJ family MFS transporter [Aurantimonas sp. Leaf443]KQT82192.1 hypothetical protein ASG48_16265 [Aurantimonas sp. Leaf443]
MHPTSRLLLGGFLTLAIVMGIGRFYYTPLLPLMQAQYGFGPDKAGLIAAANFAGYLAGSLLASLAPRGGARLAAFRLGLCASVATTIAMGLTDDEAVWLALRFVSGVASAFAMISAAGMIAESLSCVRSEARLGWIFGGVGSGIAVSGVLVLMADPFLSPSQLWLAAGFLAAAVLPLPLLFVGERALPERRKAPPPRRRAARPIAFWPLFVNYTCEGLGYSVFVTFIVAIIKGRPGLEGVGDFVWIAVGLAGLPSTLLWSGIAERIGFANALAAAYAVQIAAILLPVLSAGAPAAILAAFLFGGTFMAITVLVMPLGRHGLNGRGFAILTAGFGLGQMLGPLFAGLLVTGAAGYDRALVASAGAVAFGLAALLLAMRRRAPGAAAT